MGEQRVIFFVRHDGGQTVENTPFHGTFLFKKPNVRLHKFVLKNYPFNN